MLGKAIRLIYPFNAPDLYGAGLDRESGHDTP